MRFMVMHKVDARMEAGERPPKTLTQLGEAAGRREIEIGPVVEGWDLNERPRPDGVPYRYLLFVKGDAASEAGAAPAPAMRELLDRWKRDGVLESEATLRPTRTGARSKVVDGKRGWTDGPFAEAKELVAGYLLLEVPALEDARRFAEEYAAILGDNEVDICEVAA